MKDHVSDAQIRSYREQTLPTAELLDVSDHLAACAACRVRMATPVELRSQVSVIQAVLETETWPRHLTYDDIAAYVDGHLASEAAARVELHARECQSCDSAIGDLRVLRAELQDEPHRRWRWHGPMWLSRRPIWQGGLALAFGAAAILLIVVLARPMPRQDHSLQAERGPIKTDGSPSGSRANSGSAIRDGSRVVTIGDDGTVAGLEELPRPYQTMLEQALVAKQIPLPDWMPELNLGRGTLLGAAGTPEAIRLLSPVGTAVEEPQPVFRWTTVPGAEYQVSVYDSAYNLVGSSNWSKDSEWTFAHVLEQGKRYSWQIHMRRGSDEITIPAPPAPEARFRVLDGDARAEVARARGRWGDSHLIMGIVYASAGLLDEAEQMLRLASSQNPDSQHLAALRASVEQLRANRSKQ